MHKTKRACTESEAHVSWVAPPLPRRSAEASGPSGWRVRRANVVIRLGLLPRQYSLLFLSATSVLFVDVVLKSE